MKKVIIVAAILLVSGLQSLLAQISSVNPIPSYNFPVTSQYTAFQEKKTHVISPVREKRDVDVVISSSTSNPSSIWADVWVVNENGIIVLGPFKAYPDEILTVPIDNGQWGVIIQTTALVTASVWIE